MNLILKAWGGDVEQGEECFLFDTDRFLYRRIAAAQLVALDGNEVGLLVDNRVYQWTRVAKTEERAREELLGHARFLTSLLSDKRAAAQAFIDSQPVA